MFDIAGEAGRLETFVKQSAFWLVHLSCLLVFWVGFSWVAVGACMFFYFLRMFAITGVYHRYFSHKTYSTSRWFQFVLACLGASSAQKGPLWWASHHRHHHLHSDTEHDLHSPIVQGIYYAHVGWVVDPVFVRTKTDMVQDWLKFPELRWLERNHLIPPIVLATAIYIFGLFLFKYYPGLNVTGGQMLIWGFFVSTVLLYHGTFCINSLAHLIGNRRFETDDHSKNSFILALITLGEGWHNNHHRYPGSERQGMFWWELDITHYILKFLEKIGLIWGIKSYPEKVYKEALGSN